jgi:hypothetical protein
VDTITGQLATEFTPAERVEERDVVIFPEKYRAWAEAQGLPLLGTQQPAYAFEPELSLASPADGDTVSGLVPVFGRAHVPEPLVWRLEYGVGPSPIGWGVIGQPTGAEASDLLGEWNAPEMVARHGATDYSLRLAVYDAANMEYPVAVSNAVHVYIDLPTATPTLEPTGTPTSTVAPTETPSPTQTPSPVPTQTPSPTPATTPTATVTPTPVALEPLQARLVEPLPGSVVSGDVLVMGSADGQGFARYMIEYAPGNSPNAEDWQPLGPEITTPVSGGLLATWQTGGLTPGTYTLRLRVFDTLGDETKAEVVVEILG